MIAQIIINSNVKSLNRTFDYLVPKDLEEQIFIGACVFVPFGSAKQLKMGYVVGLKESTSYQVKQISSLSEEHRLEPKKIELAKWMARQYFCNVSDGIKLMLPPGTLGKDGKANIKEKMVRCIYLKQDLEEIQEALETKQIKSPKQIRALTFLLENEGVTASDLEVYADTSASVLKTLEKNNYIEIVEKPIRRDPNAHKKIDNTQKLVFTKEQESAYQQVAEAIDKEVFEKFLIFGITGSRKNGDLFTINRQSGENGENSHYFSSRNISYTTNARSLFG